MNERPEPREDLLDRLQREGLATTWLSTRLGIGTQRLHAMRRSGELLGVRPPGASDHFFPSWQFGDDLKPLPGIRRILAAAREEGIDDVRLYELLTMRSGTIGDRRRLADTLRGSGVDHVVAAIRAAAPAR